MDALYYPTNQEIEVEGDQELSSSKSSRPYKLKRHRSNQIFQIIKIKNKKKWTHEEDLILIKLAESHREKHWKDISKHFVNKNALQCFSRYKRIRPGIVKGAWSKEEDEKINRLVQIYGKSWSKISKVLVTRNGKQIRDRFINVLDPEIKKGKFTEEEDNTLIQLYMHYGPKWATIAKHFINRTADMIKNRFHSSIKKMFYTSNNTVRKSSFVSKKLEVDKENTYSHYEASTHKNSLSSMPSFENPHLVNTTNTFSFSFTDSKNQSPLDASTANNFDHQNIYNQPTFTYNKPMAAAIINYPQYSSTHGMERLIKMDEDAEYKEYINSLDNNLNSNNEINNNLYDDVDLINIKEDDDISYNNNSNIFNFDEYFTV